MHSGPAHVLNADPRLNVSCCCPLAAGAAAGGHHHRPGAWRPARHVPTVCGGALLLQYERCAEVGWAGDHVPCSPSCGGALLSGHLLSTVVAEFCLLHMYPSVRPALAPCRGTCCLLSYWDRLASPAAVRFPSRRSGPRLLWTRSCQHRSGRRCPLCCCCRCGSGGGSPQGGGVGMWAAGAAVPAAAADVAAAGACAVGTHCSRVGASVSSGRCSSGTQHTRYTYFQLPRLHTAHRADKCCSACCPAHLIWYSTCPALPCST